MVEGQSKPLWSGWRKVAGLSIVGGIGGYFLGKFAAESVNDGGPLANLVGVEVALLVSLLYIMMGLFVGLGSLSPRVGAALLNVEDADEVREEGPTLRLSAAGCILIGISLASIALGGAGGLLAPTMALLIGMMIVPNAILGRVMLGQRITARFTIGSAIAPSVAVLPGKRKRQSITAASAPRTTLTMVLRNAMVSELTSASTRLSLFSAFS